MNEPLEGFPTDVVVRDASTAATAVTLDATVYPLEALYGAAYIFIDRCYVLIDRPSDAQFRVTLTAKKPPFDEGVQRALAGEFVNELLSCAWRYQIARENRALIEQVTSAAMSGAMGPPSLDELEQFDFSEEPFEDPLGIAQSWEEKYKKKQPEKPSDEPVAAEAKTHESSAEKPATGGESGGST